MTYTLDVPRLVQEYRAGRSVAALARGFSVDPSAIRSRLVQAGVSIRGAREATVVNLARDPAIQAGMGRPRVHPVNPSFFDVLTEDAAYVVGLMQADGSNQTDRGTVCVTLKASDEALLVAVASAMGATRPLTTDQYGARRFLVQNRALSDGLARWGVVSPKTHTATTHPHLLGNRDYWRGVIDGDGSLCVAADGRRFLTLVGSRFMCAEFLTFARSHGAGSRVSVRPHSGIWSVHLSARGDPETVARVLYAGAGLALARKLEVARSWGCLNREVSA